MREPNNINAVSQLNIDLLGFIFWPASSRYVKNILIDDEFVPPYNQKRLDQPQDVTNLSTLNLGQIKRVGVFVDDTTESIVRHTLNFSLDYIQLHGNESRQMCETLRSTIKSNLNSDIKIMKAISISSQQDIMKYHEYEGVVDFLLFDTKCFTFGGSGVKFDWNMLEFYDGDIPFFLSGGIGPESVARVKAFSHPQFLGVDLNSRFEDAPGVKNVDRLKQFINEIRSENE